MKSYADKTHQKSKRDANSISKPQQNDGATSQLVDNRTTAATQCKLVETLHSSPKQVSQRQQFNTLFGDAAQLQMKMDSAVLQQVGPEEEELLQGKFETIQRQEGLEEEELLQGKLEAVQRQGPDEEELLQGKFDTAQRQDNLEEEELLQGKFAEAPIQRERDAKPNNTGLPDNLKTGIENLSGYSMDDVSVHYNSPKPAEIQAHAYAQGTDIHLGTGQEKHLPHEAWHVVQQKQGRVRPTMQMKTGTPVNDDPQLEKEADAMGGKALQMTGAMNDVSHDASSCDTGSCVAQLERYIDNKTSGIHLHLDIGRGDHLMIGGDRYNLMDRSGYNAGRIAIAKKALRSAPYIPDKVACWRELQKLV
ncbi:MAG: DUF4157 domain-containing protein [Pseudomonadota bacterium]